MTDKIYNTYFDAACDVLNMSPEELDRRMDISHNDDSIRLKYAWEALNPQTEEDILKYYTDDITYTLFQIRIYRNVSTDNCTDMSLFEKLKKYISNIEECKILDYGCGCGTAALSLINAGCKNVTFADLPTPLFEIVRRVQATKIGNDKFLKIVEKYPLKNRYDLIICTDVLEHIKDPDLVLKHLADHSRYIYMSVFFGGDHAPYHLKDTAMKFCPIWKDIIRSCGMVPIDIEGEDVGGYNGLYIVKDQSLYMKIK